MMLDLINASQINADFSTNADGTLNIYLQYSQADIFYKTGKKKRIYLKQSNASLEHWISLVLHWSYYLITSSFLLVLLICYY